MTVTVNSKAGGWNKAGLVDCTDGGKWTSCPIEHTELDSSLKTISMLNYQGAFRLPGGIFGASEFGYSLGCIGYNPNNNSLFVAGHETQGSIAEVSIPALITDTSAVGNLNTANVLQNFVKLMGTGIGNNTAGNLVDRVGGMEVIGNELIINGYNDYDGAGSMVDTTLVVDDADDLAGSLTGYFQLEGAAHASGFISPIPAERQADLGGTHLSGQSGINIITRTSAGPSAFAWTPSDKGVAVGGAIASVKLADYPVGRRLHNDAFNASKANKLWTFASRATYGLVVPGTKTVLNLGFTGGHETGLGYKITQDEGYTCPGYCPFGQADATAAYWLFNTDDYVAVKNGAASYTPRPYEYGPLVTPFIVDHQQRIGGGAYDEANGLLYLSLVRGDSTNPLILVYKLDGV